MKKNNNIIIGICLILFGIWVFSLFGSFDYCFTTDLEINENPILPLCLSFNIGIPIGFIVFGLIFMIDSKSNKKELIK